MNGPSGHWYASLARIQTQGATEIIGNAIQVSLASYVRIVVAARTSARSAAPSEWVQLLMGTLDRSTSFDESPLSANEPEDRPNLHVAPLGGVELDLGVNHSDVPTDERLHKVQQGELDRGLIEVGRAADFVFMDAPQHSAGKTLLESVRLGDLPGIGMVVIDGEVKCERSRNTPPATRVPKIQK